MSLLLIRHGETAFNAERVVQFPETPLGPQGCEQAERLGRHLAQQRLGLIVCSDYVRARMTADRIQAHSGAALVEDPLLRERNFGDLRGRPYAEFGALDIMARGYVPPAGESWEAFDARVDRAWAGLVARLAAHAGDIAVVTHGLVLRSLLLRVLAPNGHAIPADLTVANTSITQVERAPPWRVLELAATPHLDEPAGDVAPV